MNRAALWQRQVALAAVALLALVAALAVDALAQEEPQRQALPQSVPTPDGGWYQAVAAPYRFKANVKRTACGHNARPNTVGLAHPVLPCGTKIFIAYGDSEVLTQVIDRGTLLPGREFEVTAPLGRLIGLETADQIRWRYAAEPAR